MKLKFDRFNAMKKQTFFIKIYGCQYNEWDGAKLSQYLKDLGFLETTEGEAEIIFILLCSVRKTGVDRALGKAKNWLHKKVIVTSCVLETDKVRFLEKNVSFWPLWDFKKLSEILDVDKNLFSDADTENKTNYIPIMKGCNNFCSYCVVPYTRGRETSRSIDEIKKDAEELIKQGKKEIWLLGQNVNSYEFGFAKLLRILNDLPGNFKINFTSNHPKDMTDEIIDAIAKLPKVEKLIHLPMQSGSNKILKAMNRPYTKEQYLLLIDKIKTRIPGVRITTDSIVGFPGETEEDFQETVEVFKKVQFYQAYNNKYSPREGTASFKLGDPVPWPEKQRRWRILNELVNLER